LFSASRAAAEFGGKVFHRVGKFSVLKCVIQAIVQSNDPVMQKTESISLRVTEEVKKAVERAARCQQLTTAGLVERILIEGLTQGGYLHPTKSAPRAAGTQTGESTIT
jgi:hypothetical protein